MRVVVTGANRGIGRAIALRLARDGAGIAAVGRSHPDELESLAAAIRNTGGRCTTITANLAEPDAPAEIVASAAAALGGIDAIISNAAFSPTMMPIVEHPAKNWDRCYAVTLRAAWLLAKAAHPHLKASRGSFIAISSIGGHEPAPLVGIYCSAKAALNMLIRGLAQEWGQDGIRANCVSPGMVRTPMSEVNYADRVRYENRLRLIPLQRIGTPDDTADAVAWLLSADAAGLTGQALIVDGGYVGSVQAHVTNRPPWLAQKA
jgi:glucose 1-dehydrogenase